MKTILAEKQAHFIDALAIRTLVFIGEQDVPVWEEIDDYDRFVPLFVIYEGNRALGTARIIPKEKGIYKIGRVANRQEARSRGVGKKLMQDVMNYIKKETMAKEICLDAQLTAVPFYEKLGFNVYGEVFQDAGIDHISMSYKG